MGGGQFLGQERDLGQVEDLPTRPTSQVNPQRQRKMFSKVKPSTEDFVTPVGDFSPPHRILEPSNFSRLMHDIQMKSRTQ
jgi:hypothetical protein